MENATNVGIKDENTKIKKEYTRGQRLVLTIVTTIAIIIGAIVVFDLLMFIFATVLSRFLTLG